jgi:hypothetical protein
MHIVFDLVIVNFQKDIQFQHDILSRTPGRRNVKICKCNGMRAQIALLLAIAGECVKYDF